MGKSQSINLVENLDMIIQRIESQIDLISKPSDVYNSQYCSKDNEDSSVQYSNNIGECFEMKKPFKFAYEFKSHCTSINERLFKLEGCGDGL